MLVKFQGEETGSITMFGPVAEQLLKLMGMSGNLEGAMTAEEVPTALTKLETAVAAIKAQADNDYDDDDDEVSLAVRAVPLLDLLKEAATNNGYVMWQPE